MSLEADEEILQDFLVEAGELLESLSEQLVELENSPDDSELLNAIFRGFHTVKGGAGFLQLEPLVDLCHAAENAFDCLRNGKIQVSTVLMDVVLESFDSVNDMFEKINQRIMPEPASPELIHSINQLAKGEMPDQASAEPEPQVATPAQESPASDQAAQAVASFVGSTEEITDDEFEALLDQLHGGPDSPQAAQPATANASGDEKPISEEEFEGLLDQIHGAGNGPTQAKAPASQVEAKGSSEDQAQLESIISDLKQSAESAPAPSKPIAKASTAPGKKDSVPAKKESAPAETTVRVDTRRLDEIMNMVGELVLVRNRLVRLGVQSTDEAMAKAVANLDVVTADLQTSVMKTRMQPIKKVFGRFPRVVRDLARQLKKEINLELVGEDTDLDKNLVEALADPLVHLVRNSVDHGIELPDVREQNGKSRVGKVTLSAQQEGDHIVLSITDDGGGMDAQALRNRAASKGLMDQDTADRLSDVEAYNLIFAPGFSTKDEISDVSGRGVGMDVVKTKISQLNGQLEVQSKLGQGTVIAIKVPLTLAIMPTLMVMLAKQTFALPLMSVNEIFHLDLSATNVVDGQEVVIVRDKALPLFHLKRWLVEHNETTESVTGHVVIVTVGTQNVGFVVDQLIGQEEVVIKPLGRMLHGTQGMAGATITGDGRIALILDVPSMLKRYAGTY